jgi:hypothetical protein
MISLLRSRLTYANVTATLALFIALGGSSYAAIAITGRDVRDHSLTGRDLVAGSVGSTEIRNGSVRGIDIRNGTISEADLQQPLRRNLLPDTQRGAPGPTGATGPVGDAGPKGDTGPAGLKGGKGDTGDSGPTGASGPSGSTGPLGPIGPVGPSGPAGPAGPPGPSEVNAAPADTTQSNAATFSFGGAQRVAIGQQPNDPPACCYVPGSGLVEVASGTGRHTQLTHYQYGSTLRSTGPESNIFEFFLGDDGTGQAALSVRNNGNGSGASVQARNGADTSGIVIDYAEPLRPRLHLEDDGRVPGAVLGIENPQAGGTIALATRTGGLLVDHMVLDSLGTLTTDGNVVFGNQASDKVLFHGATGSGAQGTDPGSLPDLTAADVGTPTDIATHINEDRAAINALRQALLQQGLIGP